MNECLQIKRCNCFRIVNESLCINPTEEDTKRRKYTILYKHEDCPMAEQCKLKSLEPRWGMALVGNKDEQ